MVNRDAPASGQHPPRRSRGMPRELRWTHVGRTRQARPGSRERERWLSCKVMACEAKILLRIADPGDAARIRETGLGGQANGDWHEIAAADDEATARRL